MKDKQLKLDQLDFLMIKELETDGRQTITDLAKKLGTSKATARRKLNTLLEKKVISVVAIVDPPVIGYQTTATIGISVQPGKVDDVAEKLCAHKNVFSVRISVGRYDILVWVVLKSPNDLGAFLKDELGNMSGIVKTETMLTLELKKRSFACLGDDIVASKRRTRRSKKTA